MTIQQALKEIGRLLAIEMDRSIDSQTSARATGDLGRSITYKVREDKNGTILERTMDKYGDYVDSGVKGTKHSYASNPRSIYPQGQFKKKAIAPESGLKWPVRIYIAQNGLKPKPFIGTSISKVMDDKGIDLLLEAGVSQVGVMIGKELTNITIG
jgi:hypothetical protein